ncbi:MAG: hypothetical protein ABR541_08280 [Candidatus Dormibacteria bacterium]
MNRQLRIRGFDPVVLGVGMLVAVAAVLAGAGAWAVAAGLLPLLAAVGARELLAAIGGRVRLPPSGTPERALIVRAEAASQGMRRIVRTVPAGPTAERCRQMELAARGALPTIRGLAVQARMVGQLAAGVDVEQLEREHEQTTAQLAAAVDAGTRAELEASLRSTETQLATARRLRALAGELAARTRALTSSMEAVVAGLTELLALSADDPGAQPHSTLNVLSREIEALRGGLEEAQRFGRQASAGHLVER